MAWLQYSDGEVPVFHPVFQQEADLSLEDLGLSDSHRWDHHPADGGEGTPDFVLREIATDRWIVAVEIKRTPQSVWSPQTQMQAKGYAEANQAKYRAGWPAYFAISNLEIFLLGSLNGTAPPKECIIEGGVYETAKLGSIGEVAHRALIRNSITKITQVAVQIKNPSRDTVWPSIIDHWLESSAQLPPLDAFEIAPPQSESWAAVGAYFGDLSNTAGRRALLLRCLALEYVRGTLAHYNHPQSQSIPPLKSQISSVAKSLNAMRKIDFDTIFEGGAAEMYASLSDPTIISRLTNYIQSVISPPNRVAELASRADAPSFIDSLFVSLLPPDDQQAVGKVQTDPELAAVLATITIQQSDCHVVDVGCGDGSLLSAAYDRLVALGASPEDMQDQLLGIEADPISLRIASLRLALKEPRLIYPEKQARLVYGDVFANGETIAESEVVLMNPPFKRYEAQDESPVPSELREHYAARIRSAGGSAISNQGQANLYSFYVEFVTVSMKPGAVAGIVLDNKWYHNKYAAELRQVLLANLEILALVEYPHTAFFRDWMVSTSLLVVRKVALPEPNHAVNFIRCRVDPRSTDLNELGDAINGSGAWPLDWVVRSVPQRELDAKEGWKRYFCSTLKNDFREWALPTLPEIFPRSRRGSLNKEGGGLEVLEFPFNRPNYGPRRLPPRMGSAPYSTVKDRKLDPGENARLRDLAAQVPIEYRGFALRNSDGLSGYVLAEADVSRDMTFEPPLLRGNPLYRNTSRVRWNDQLQAGLDQLIGQPQVAAYLAQVDMSVNISDAVPVAANRWLALREPVAGGLIIPRKLRNGYRLHINPYEINADGRQVRLSSNFISYGGVIAVDLGTELDAATSLELVASFLLSSFGQLQLESLGYNREGMLAVEKMHLDKVKVFDPRWVAKADRAPILEEFRSLPYPLRFDTNSTGSERENLDRLWAEQLAMKFDVSSKDLLAEVSQLLDEFLQAREE